MEEKLTLSRKEHKRLMVLNEVEKGKVLVREAAGVLGLSERQGYFLLLRQIVEREGIPLAVYRDRHGIFERPKKEVESLEEELTGSRNLTQFGRLVRELGVESIPSRSPPGAAARPPRD